MALLVQSFIPLSTFMWKYRHVFLYLHVAIIYEFASSGDFILFIYFFEKLECGPFSLICLTFSPVQSLIPGMMLVKHSSFLCNVADYCLSNGYINRIITHQFKFDGGDLVPYYISFLRFSFF